MFIRWSEAAKSCSEVAATATSAQALTCRNAYDAWIMMLHFVLCYVCVCGWKYTCIYEHIYHPFLGALQFWALVVVRCFPLPLAWNISALVQLNKINCRHNFPFAPVVYPSASYKLFKCFLPLRFTSFVTVLL